MKYQNTEPVDVRNLPSAAAFLAAVTATFTATSLQTNHRELLGHKSAQPPTLKRHISTLSMT